MTQLWQFSFNLDNTSCELKKKHQNKMKYIFQKIEFKNNHVHGISAKLPNPLYSGNP